MKKFIMMLLVLALTATLLFALTACGKTETPEVPVDSIEETSDTTTDTEAPESEEDTTEAETFEQEIFGQGSESDPYLLTPADMSVTTTEISILFFISSISCLLDMPQSTVTSKSKGDS